MPTKKLGVHGKDLPVRRGRTLSPANFLLGGIIAKLPRQFAQAFLTYSPVDVATIFDVQVDSSTYGWDSINGFFQNAVGVNAGLYVVSHVGYTGTAIDAVTASASLNDTMASPQVIITLQDAYQGIRAYGTSGNRTGYQIELGDRFATTIMTTGSALDTFVYMSSVADVFVGDIIKIVASGGTPGTIYRKVTAIDQSIKKVSFTDAVGAGIPTAADVVTVPGFRIHTYRKTILGLEQEVDTNLGKTWLTTEPEVVKYYAPNVFGILSSVQNGQSGWLSVTVNTTTGTADKKFPAAVSTTTYLASGAAGTAPSTAAHWSADLALFTNKPVRFLANCETTVDAVHKAGETYCKARVDDHPKWLVNLPEAQTKAQLLTAGYGWQRGDEVDALVIAQWYLVTDPFNTNPAGAYRHIPNVGHEMGKIMRSIGTNGIHYIHATKDMPTYGIQGISGDQFLDDQDRTDLANAGVNVAQFVQGFGFITRNAFTPSTDSVYQFFNAIVMRDYFKVSAIDSLQSAENKPNSLVRIGEDAIAVQEFMRQHWERGSTGNVPLGETFGQYIDEAGNPSKFEDHVEVRGDLTNNTLASVQAGEEYINAYFTFPAPAGVIVVGVGIQVRS